MDIIFRIDIDIVALIVLSIVYRIAYKRLDKNDKMNKLFLRIALLIGAQLIIEIVVITVDGLEGKFIWIVKTLSHMSLYTFGPYLGYLWCNIIYRWIMPNDNQVLKNNKRFIIPLILNTLITVTSPFTNLVYYINESNVYYRGSLFIIPILISFLYLSYGFLIIIQYKNLLLKEEYIPLLVFCIFPVIACLIQVVLYGILLMWSSTAFSYVILYIYIQSKMLQLDSLTGAWTRESFERYLELRTHNEDRNSKFGIAFIDLDNFKHINDTFGHLEGDYALQTVVRLIKNSIRKTDIIARFGGDEFVIMLSNVTIEDMGMIIYKIKSKFDLYNINSDKFYKLEYSCGFDVFDSEKYSIEQFINYVDHLMYIDKDKKKVYKKVEGLV